MKKDLNQQTGLSIVVGCLVLSVVVHLAANFYFRLSPLADWVTFWAVLLLAGVLAGGMLVAGSAGKAILAVLSVHFVIYSFPRLMTYMALPYHISFPFGWDASTDTTNAGLMYVLAGVCSLVLGALLGGKFLGRSNDTPELLEQSTPTPKGRLSGLLFAFVVICILDLIVVFGLGLSVFSVKNVEAPLMHYLTIILRMMAGIDTAFALLLGAALCGTWKKQWGKTLFVSIISVLYLVSMTIGGSKGGILRIDILLMCFLIAYGLTRNFSLKVFLSILFVSMVVAPLNFYLGSFYRNQDAAQKPPESMANVYEEIYAPPAGFLAAGGGEQTLIQTDRRDSNNKPIVRREMKFEEIKYAIPILNRLGEIDYSILTIAFDKGQPAKTKYFSFEYFLKSTLNILLPGTPFEEAALPTSRTKSVIYRGIPETTALHRFNTEPWLIWALFYFHFGWFGGLVAAFLVGLIFVLAYSKLRKGGGERHFTYSAIFLCFVFLPLVQAFGFDHFVTLIVFIGLQILFVEFLVRIYSFLEAKFKKLRPV